MKIKELIELLKKYDPELQVKYFNKLEYKDVTNIEIEYFFAGTNDIIFPGDIDKIENEYKEKGIIFS